MNAPLATGSAAAAGSEFTGRTRGLEAAGEKHFRTQTNGVALKEKILKMILKKVLLLKLEVRAGARTELNKAKP